MIDLTSSLIRIIRGCGVFGPRIYRAHPALTPESPWAVVAPTGRMALEADDDGAERLVSQTWTVSIGASSVGGLDDAVSAVSDAVARYNVRTVSLTSGWDERYQEYTADIGLAVTADKRGLTYQGA